MEKNNARMYEIRILDKHSRQIRIFIRNYRKKFSQSSAVRYNSSVDSIAVAVAVLLLRFTKAISPNHCPAINLQVIYKL